MGSGGSGMQSIRSRLIHPSAAAGELRGEPRRCSAGGRHIELVMTSNRYALGTSGAIRKWYSPALYSLQRTLLPVLQWHARGALLDAGCGAMPYRTAAGSAVTS